MKRSKYNSRKVEVNGITFDSKDEALYYEHLLDFFERGSIKNIALQPKYELIPKFTDYSGKTHRATTYTPDFLIVYNDGSEQLIDIKGFGTQQGDLRRKIFLWRYPNIPLVWLSRNIKYGDVYGWIEYDELKKIRAKNKKEKATK